MDTTEAGRKGGRSRSAAKLAAQRINARKGGRPQGAKDSKPRRRRAKPVPEGWTDAQWRAAGL